MESRSLPPQRAPGGHTGLRGPLELEMPVLREKQGTWRRAATLTALIAVPWAAIGAAVAAALLLL